MLRAQESHAVTPGRRHLIEMRRATLGTLAGINTVRIVSYKMLLLGSRLGEVRTPARLMSIRYWPVLSPTVGRRAYIEAPKGAVLSCCEACGFL